MHATWKGPIYCLTLELRDLHFVLATSKQSFQLNRPKYTYYILIELQHHLNDK